MEASLQRLRPRYTGEDTRPTSQKEIWGWYTYGLAAEIFAVCGPGSFLPVTIEQLARERGVFKSDGVTPCLAQLAGAASLVRRTNDEQCVLHVFGVEMNTSSFALYTFSVSVMVQTLTLVSVSAIADYGDTRKKMLLILGFSGATACMFFLLVTPGVILLASLLAVITITCLGCSNVLLNSFLPVMVANHPSILSSDHELEDFDDSLGLDDLDEHSKFDRVAPDSQKKFLKLSNRISSTGVGIGYAGAVVVQVISVVFLITFGKMFPATAKSSISMRSVLFIVGICWALFTAISARWLRRRPGPPLPLQTVRRGYLAAFSYVIFAWKSLWRTLKLALQLRQMIVFLAGWFLLSDALATISGTAILLARTELHMGTAPVAALSITVIVAGIGGAVLWPVIGRTFKLRTNQIIMACMILLEFVPLYGLLSFLPFIQRWGVGGLQQVWEIYMLGIVYGFVGGGLSSHCRSFFGVLIPPGSEAAFYALMAVTDKGSSVIGPAIVGRIVDKTGSIRTAFFFLAPLILLPTPIMWYVDADRGTADAIVMAETLRKWGGDGSRTRDERLESIPEVEELLGEDDHE